MATGAVTMRLSQNLAGCLLFYGPCEMFHSETLPAHLNSVLGSSYPRHIRIMTWSEHAHLCRVKTDISAMLMDTSGLDSHMMSKLDSHGYWRRIYGLRWLPRVMAGLISHVLIWDGYPMCSLGLLPHVSY